MTDATRPTEPRADDPRVAGAHDPRPAVHTRELAPPGLLSRVSWGAIFAGAVVSIALMVLFTLLGFAIGFGVIDPANEQNPLAGIGTSSGIYFVVTQLISLGVGGFVAARLSGIPVMMTAALHGFAVWSVATIAVVLLGFTGASSVAGGLTSMAGQTIGSAASAIRSVVPDDVDLPSIDLSEIEMSDLPEEVQQTLREQDVTPAQLRRESREAFRQVVSQREQDRLMRELQETATEIIASPGNIEQDLQDLREQVLGEGGILGQEDIAEARGVMQRRLGITAQEAQQLVDQAETQLEEAVTEIEQAVQTAQEEALEAAQAVTDAVANASLLAFIASLLGLLAALGGGVAGKPKRALAEADVRHG